jgi:hypothetical protein
MLEMAVLRAVMECLGSWLHHLHCQLSSWLERGFSLMPYVSLSHSQLSHATTLAYQHMADGSCYFH